MLMSLVYLQQGNVKKSKNKSCNLFEFHIERFVDECLANGVRIFLPLIVNYW